MQARPAIVDRLCLCPRGVRERACQYVSFKSPSIRGGRSPLKIIWSGVLMFSIWAELTHIAGRLVHKTMSDHLVLPLEALSTFTSWAAFDWAEVWSGLRMDIRMRTK